MARNIQAAVKHVEQMLKAQYNRVFDDCEGLDPDEVAKDLANGEEPQAIVDWIASNFELKPVVPVASKADRALRIAMVGKAQEYGRDGRKQNPHGGVGLTPAEEDEFGEPRDAVSNNIVVPPEEIEDDEDIEDDFDDNDM